MSRKLPSISWKYALQYNNALYILQIPDQSVVSSGVTTAAHVPFEDLHNIFWVWQKFVLLDQEELRGTRAAPAPWGVDTLRLAWSSSGSGGGGGHSMTICPHKKCTLEITFLKTESKLYFPLTSPTALVRIWMILSCGVATTLCVLISMMRWPTRMPPRSAMPPRIRLQICKREENKHKKQTQRKERFLFCQRTNSNERRSSCEDEHRGTREAGLTMPSSTLKPSWNLGSGLLMIAMVTGGQCTMLSFTYFWLLRSWDGNEMRIGKLTCRHISVALTLYHL